MSAKERADAEVREAEEQRRQNEARLARERQQAAERAGAFLGCSCGAGLWHLKTSTSPRLH